jgi:hypothetical protein
MNAVNKPNYFATRARICADAMQTIADTVWDALGQSKTPDSARRYIGAMPYAPNTDQLYVGQADRWIPLADLGDGDIIVNVNSLEFRKNPENPSSLQTRTLGSDDPWVDAVDLEDSVTAEEVPGDYTPVNYTPVDGESMRDHLEGVDAALGDIEAEDVESDYTPVNYTAVDGTSVRDHLEGIDQAIAGILSGTVEPADDPIEGVVVIAPGGNDANSGESHRSAVATFERAVELAETINGRKVIYVYPNPLGYSTEGELPWPDLTSIISVGKARATAIRPIPGRERRNVFLAGNGFYCNGISFEGFQIDNLEDPTVGFGVAFRPGAVIRRLPYITDCVAYRAQDPSQIPPPGQPELGNPLVGNGGGCVLVDGAVCSQYSVPQMMTWGFTPSVPNGIGYCVKNGGFVNPVSAIGLWCRVNMLALSGGRIQASGCATQFGDYAFWAAGSTRIVEPEKYGTAFAADGGLAAAIGGNSVAIIDAMWLNLVAAYPSSPATGSAWSADEEYFTRVDAASFLLALRYCFSIGRSESMNNFARGLFDYKGDYVFNSALKDAFKHTFNFMADEVKILAGAAGDTAIDGLVAALNATLDNYVSLRRPEPSYINAINHQMTQPGTGVTYAALPALFGFQGRPKPMDRVVYTDGIGRVDWSASDDAGTTQWIGGARIDGLTGELGGPPVDAYIRRQIETGMAAAFGF